MKPRLLILLTVLALVAAACSPSSSDGDAEVDETTAATEAPAEDATEGDGDAMVDSDEPIVIPLHNWSSQLTGAYVLGHILEQVGATVEYVSADSSAVYASMCEGDVHIVHEVWQGAFGVPFEEQVAAGCVIDAATHEALTREEWWYPSYVEEVCPGLPDWEALNDCSALFATAETGDKGRFLGGPAEWLKGDEERVEGLGMNFVVVNAGSADVLWAELAAASENNEPIVLFNWTPNFIEALYEGSFIEFPEFTDECRTDPAAGVNPETTHDCGNPKDGYLKIGVWEGFEETWPGIYETVKLINFSNLDIAVMAKLVDIDELEPEAAAEQWLAENTEKWQPWIGG